MAVRRSVLAATCGAILLCSLVVPAPASAQGYVSLRVGRGPVVYDPWYPSRSAWYPPYGAGVRPYQVYGDLSASLRIQVRPRDAEVFVDGYYVGVVDDFDGVFQRLHVEPGEHGVELYMPGYRSAEQRIFLQPGRTSHIRLEMEPLAPGDPLPVRPTGAPRPAPADRSARPGPVRQTAPLPPDPAGAPPVAIAPIDRSGSYGTLSVLVQPGDARILIDGEPWEGRTDAGERLVVQVAAGRRVVEVERDGYRDYVTEVTVRAGETTTLNVALTAQ
jgi:hypothetical protein